MKSVVPLKKTDQRSRISILSFRTVVCEEEEEQDHVDHCLPFTPLHLPYKVLYVVMLSSLSTVIPFVCLLFPVTTGGYNSGDISAYFNCKNKSHVYIIDFITDLFSHNYLFSSFKCHYYSEVCVQWNQHLQKHITIIFYIEKDMIGFSHYKHTSVVHTGKFP